MRNYQTGQALPLGMALILFAALGALVLFNTGRTATDKARLANTADAAAYSGLLWQARALNFQAYTNRAMVANQVSIAQAVSLRSWVLYGRVSTENINVVLENVPFVGAITATMKEIMDAAESMIGPIAEAMVKVVDQVNGALSNAQRAMYLSSFAATPEIVSEVVQANDARFSSDTRYGLAALGKNLGDWKTFTAGYDKEDVPDMRRKADVVNRSLDRFSQKRKWRYFKYWFPLSPFTLVKLQREGTTRLVERVTENGVEFEWKAKDNLSLNTRIWRPFNGWKRFEAPIGWGEAFANTRGDETIERPDAGSPSLFQPYAKWFRRNAWAEFNGDYGVHGLEGSPSLAKIGGYNGMRAYRTLSAMNRAADDPRMELRVEVSMDLGSVKSSDRFTTGTTFSAPLTAPGDVLTSISVAEVFYEQPLENGSRSLQEANGYNPYWDVRLKAVPAADRALAVSLRPAGNSPSSVPFGGTALNEYAENAHDTNNASVAQDASDDIAAIEALMSNLDPQSAAYAELQAIRGSLQSGLDESIDSVQLPGFSGQTIAQLEQQANALQTEFSEELEQSRDAIESGLERALDDALADILAGAASGMGIDIQDAEAVQRELARTQAHADNVQSTFDTASGNAEARADAVREEFEQIRVEVAQSYQPERNRIVAEYQDNLDELNAELREAQAAVARSFNSNQEREQAERRVAALRDQLGAAQDVMYTELARELQTIVNSQSDVIELSFDDAYRAARSEYLSGEDIVEQIGIAEILDEDESEYE